MSDNTRFTIKQMSEEDRPREKMISKGCDSLSNSELLAILIGSGSGELTAIDVGRNILNAYNNNLLELSKATFKELLRFKGIGDARAINIMAALELGKRRASSEALDRNKINDSKDVYNYMRHKIGDLNHEEFWAIYLNNSNMILGTEGLSVGGMTATVVDVRVLMKRALELNATSFIITHNHPSGNTLSSRHDDEITTQIARAGDMMNIKLIDHIIVSQSGFYSYRDNNKI